VTRRSAVEAALASDEFSWGEKKILEWQFRGEREGDSFFVKLLRALGHADPENEERILVAFPELAEAWRSFRYSSAFSVKCSAHGISP
jgi:hypothetical protein